MTAVALETRNDIAIARMQHGRASALDLEFCADLIAMLQRVASGPARALVLTGTGTIFSAGVDLLRLQQGGTSYIEEFVPMIGRLVHALFEFPKPMIAAINGHAVAGGCVIACTADHRIMARGNGRIGVPELQVGVPFPTAALEMVRFVVPPNLLQSVVYEGATFLPDDALRVGFADELVDASELMPLAVRRAEALAALPAAAFAVTKRQLRAPVLQTIAAGAARDAEVALLWQIPEALSRIRSYVERTFKPAR